ncbi:MAG: hypothetical protein CVU00_07615 [Bacteroidetes bacterium HGW-Bacteroidetes-17]|nr:MAG: hypothetical protein CVU00_07615 [Bacteroidetes bacterium HGW-Bacteroidetes-17]
MTKKFMIVFFISALFVSCVNQTQKAENESDEVATLTELHVDDFDIIAADLVGKEIVLTGTVNHVCEHGGKKMFLVEEGSEASVKITPNESMAAFNTNLVGSVIKVEGIVEELIIDEEYLMKWESELMSSNTEGGDGHGLGKGEAADMGEHVAAAESIANYRKQIAENEKGYLAFYSIVCKNYEMIKAKEKEE